MTIQEQIEWLNSNGGFVGKDLADTMTKMNRVVEAAENMLIDCENSRVDVGSIGALKQSLAALNDHKEGS